MILRDDIYHLIYSAGSYQGTKADCRYVVAHASSRSLRGPYVKTPEPILAGRPGAVYGPVAPVRGAAARRQVVARVPRLG